MCTFSLCERDSCVNDPEECRIKCAAAWLQCLATVLPLSPFILLVYLFMENVEEAMASIEYSM